MRLIDADELKTAFPCGEIIRTESVRATIDHMKTITIRCFDCGNNYCRAKLENKDCPVLHLIEKRR